MKLISRWRHLMERRRSGFLTSRDIVEMAWLTAAERTGLRRPEKSFSTVADFTGKSHGELLQVARQMRSEFKLAWTAGATENAEGRSEIFSRRDWYSAYYAYAYRNKTWHYIAKLMPGPKQLDYGCGAAEMTAWLRRRYPGNRYAVADLETGGHMPYLRWRFENTGVEVISIDPSGAELPLNEQYDLITCFGVLSVIDNPVEVIQHLVSHTSPGGRLLLDYWQIGRVRRGSGFYAERAVQQRGEAIEYLAREMRPLVPLTKLGEDESISDWRAWGLYERPA